MGIWLRLYRDATLIRQAPVTTGQDGRRQSTTISTRDDSATTGAKVYSVKAVLLHPSEVIGWDKTVRVSRTLFTATQLRK